MQAEMLQPEDKSKFVKGLYDYASRAINQKVKGSYAEKTGMSESSFRDKMCGARSFKGFELDTVLSIYSEQLGRESFDNQFRQFLTKMSDGDARTIDMAQDIAIAELSEQNELMAVGKILV